MPKHSLQLECQKRPIVLQVETGATNTADLRKYLEPQCPPDGESRDAKGLAAGLCADVSPTNELVFVCLQHAVLEGLLLDLSGDVRAIVRLPELMMRVNAQWAPCGRKAILQGVRPSRAAAEGKVHLAMDLKVNMLF